MELQTEIVEMLYDLAAIQHDRINGYAKAYQEYRDSYVNTFVRKLLIESRCVRLELAEEIISIDGKIRIEKSGCGELYHEWVKHNAVFTGNNNDEIIRNCDHAEYVTQLAYSRALQSGILPSYIREMLLKQQEMLRNCHEKNKNITNENRMCA